MATLGLLTTPLPFAYGDLGTEAGGHLILLRLLAAIGGGDLVLGRLYEDHVSGLILVASFGTPQQIMQAAQDTCHGLLFGVWTTGARDLLCLGGVPNDYTFRGVKKIASDAVFVKRTIVPAEREGFGWQMTLPRMESAAVAQSLIFDKQFWHPLGMEASESYGTDFTGACVTASDLIGAPGNFYREPPFAVAPFALPLSTQALYSVYTDSLQGGWREASAAMIPTRLPDLARSHSVHRKPCSGSDAPPRSPKKVFHSTSISSPWSECLNAQT